MGARSSGTARHARVAAIAGIAAAILALVVTVVGGALRPEYSGWSQFISELGERGSPNGAIISLAGFLPTGVLGLLFAISAAPALVANRLGRLGLVSWMAVPTAYIVAAFARCDPGCPADGSPAQMLHNFFGLLEYAGGGFGLIVIGTVWRSDPSWQRFATPSVLAGIVAWACLLAMLVPVAPGVRGLIQRLAEATLFAWMLAVSIRLQRKSR